MMENLMTSINYPYANFLRDVDRIITWLKPQRKGYTRYGIAPWDPDCVVSINRGGLVLGVYLSHALEVPHYPIHYQTKDVVPGGHNKNKWTFSFMPPAFFSEKNVLLVDDINDTGKTFTDIMKWWEKNTLGDVPMRKRVKIVSLVQRTSSKFVVDFAGTIVDNKKWIVFPWETRSGGIICANDLDDKKGEEQNASTE